MECVAELENGLACKNRCESQVEILNRMISDRKHVIGGANKQLKASGIFSLMMGAPFLYLAAVGYTKSGESPYQVFYLAMGILLVVFGAYSLWKQAKFPVVKEETRA